MIGGGNDLGERRHVGGAGAMHFDTNLHAIVLAELAALMQCLADLLDRLFDRHLLGQTIRPHLHTAGIGVVRQFDPGFGQVDVLLHYGRIGRMVFAGAAVADQFDAGLVLDPLSQQVIDAAAADDRVVDPAGFALGAVDKLLEGRNRRIRRDQQKHRIGNDAGDE